MRVVADVNHAALASLRQRDKEERSQLKADGAGSRCDGRRAILVVGASAYPSLNLDVRGMDRAGSPAMCGSSSSDSDSDSNGGDDDDDDDAASEEGNDDTPATDGAEHQFVSRTAKLR